MAPATARTGTKAHITRVSFQPTMKAMVRPTPMLEMFCRITPSLEPVACKENVYVNVCTLDTSILSILICMHSYIETDIHIIQNFIHVQLFKN